MPCSYTEEEEYMKNGLKSANLLLTFILELVVLIALGYWGFHLDGGMPLPVIAGLGAPLLAIVVWALFGAPRGKWHLQGMGRLFLIIVFAGSGALALIAAGQLAMGIALALIYALNYGLNRLWKQDDLPPAQTHS
jgi:hypothetical protein